MHGPCSDPTTKCDQDSFETLGKLESLHTAGGDVKWGSCCGKQCGGASKKNSTSGYIPKRIGSRISKKYLHVQSSIIHNS